MQVETLLRIELDYLESLTEGPPGTMERDVHEYMYVTFLLCNTKNTRLVYGRYKS